MAGVDAEGVAHHNAVVRAQREGVGFGLRGQLFKGALGIDGPETGLRHGVDLGAAHAIGGVDAEVGAGGIGD